MGSRLAGSRWGGRSFLTLRKIIAVSGLEIVNTSSAQTKKRSLVLRKIRISGGEKNGSVPLQADEIDEPDVGGKHKHTAGEARRPVDEDGGETADELLQHHHEQLVCFGRAGEGRWRWRWWSGRPACWS